jgi:hypothetical protein
MAAIAVTAASVVCTDNNAKIIAGTSGVAITAGQVVALNPTTGLYELADSDSASAYLNTPSSFGVCLNSAPAASQPIDVLVSGTLTINAVGTKGTVYIISPTAGGIAPAADALTGIFTTVIGVGVSTTSIKINCSTLMEAGVAT